MTDRGNGLPRSVEVAVASIILVVASPVLAAVACAVALSSRGPVLFRHERAGRGGRPFMMLKFRTMRVGSPGPDVTATTDPRITIVGKVLRKTKLDELPELWNIVRGDMALVGPRPESTKYVDLTDGFWNDVLRVRPGVTDPMTLRLRNEEELLASAGLDPEAFYRTYLVPYKLRGYREYLAVRTWRSDIAVLMRTVVSVLLPQTAPPPTLQEVVSRSTWS